MSNSKQHDWVGLILSRFEDQLPCRSGPQTYHSKLNAENVKTWIVKISSYKFALVFPGLIKILSRLCESTSLRPAGSDMDKLFYDSLITVLDTLEKCLANQPKDVIRVDDALNVKLLLRELCQLLAPELGFDCTNNNSALRTMASKVLQTLSLNFFNVVFNRISTRLDELIVSAEENPDYGDIELIQHMSVDMTRLIKLLNEIISRLRSLKKSAHLPIVTSLEAAIWNWLDFYPAEFAALHDSPNNDLTRCCDTLFDMLDSLVDAKKYRSNVWSLQLLLLVLSPQVLEEIINAESGAPCSPQYHKKKHFLEILKKSINVHSVNKHYLEPAAIALVKLCKAATYIDMRHSTNKIFTLLPTVINDLTSLMFNPNKPYAKCQPYANQDIDTMTECFVSCFRLKPHNKDALKVCLNSDSTPIYHYILINSLFRVIRERRLPWWPKIDLFYGHSAALRSMFADNLTKVSRGFISHTPLRMIQSLSLKSKDSSVKLKDRGGECVISHKVLLLSMVKLIHADPTLMLSNQNINGHEVLQSTVELINGLLSLVHQITMTDVAEEAMEALLVLHHPDKIEMWNPEAPINTFWDVSSQVLFSISQKMIQHQILNYTDILKWLRQILKQRNEFLNQYREYANVGTHIPVCIMAHIKLEVVFLLYLWSVETEAVSIAMSCFNLICEEADIRCSSEDVTIDQLLPNHRIYRELAEASANGGQNRSELQAKVMSILRKLKHSAESVKLAWEETFRNWEISTKIIISYSKAKTDEFPLEVCHRTLSKRRTSQHNSEPDIEEQIREWTYMAGFLCSVGGVLIPDKGSGPSFIRDSEVGKNFPLVTNQDVQYCPVKQFLSQLLRILLRCNEKYGIVIQKHIKDLVGNEMNSALYPILFEEIRTMVDKFFDHQGQAITDPCNTQFIEHIVIIMKMVLEKRMDEPRENIGATSIEGMILAIVRYVRHLDNNVPTICLKTRICQLVDTIIKRRDDLSFHHEMKFRNKMVEYLTDWIMGVSHQVSTMNYNEIPPVTRELDQACVEAVAGLLKGLPMQPEESDRNDLNEAKSQLFLKYFTLFMHLLNNCADLTQQIEKKGSPLRDAEVGKLNALRSATIQAISNLLSANIDSGLMHSIVATHRVTDANTKRDITVPDSVISLSHYVPLDFSYSKDTQNRVAFMEVLTKILQQGAEFNMLADSVLSDRYEQLVQLVTMISDKGELPIALALANVVTSAQMDELARVFVTIFESKHMFSPLLWNMFYREVEASECIQTLFRGNSLGTKIMAFCFKIYGTAYLQNLLSPFIMPLIENEPPSFEVDPAKVHPADSLVDNQRNLITLTQNVFNAIVSSGPLFPSQLRSMCHCLYQVLSKRFSNTASCNISSVGTLIFLRFINPAVVSPQEYGVVDVTVPPQVKRGLTLMSKILQNIANHVEFSKEQHMKCFNEFVRHNFEGAKRFFVQISSDCETEAEHQTTISFVSEANVQTLHKLLYTHQEKIGEFLTSSRDHKAVGRRPFDKLATLLAYLGPPQHKITEQQWCPLDVYSVLFEGKIHNMHLSPNDFMYFKNLNVFYQFGKSKNNNPVFYFIGRRFKSNEIKCEKFLVYVIQTLDPFSQGPFELFVDFTHTGPENRFNSSLLKGFLNGRNVAWQNLCCTYIYNINTWVREFTKFHEGYLAPIKSNRNIIFVDSIARISDYIAHDQQKLPGGTLAMEEDLKVFNGGAKISHKDIKISIKIGPSSLQLTHTDKCKVLAHSVLLNDIYYASEIDDVSVIDGNQFTLTILNDASGLTLWHHDSEIIVKCLVHIRKRWQLSQPDSVAIHHKIRPKDVPGTLLNMALLNLGSADPDLRTAAYNQLCALTKKFDLKIEGRLLETSCVCIPSNNTIFIKSVSETLAMNETRLTLEFLEECIQSFQISNIETKHLCLEYMTPWLPNLAKFYKSSDQSKIQKVKTIIGKLITLTIQEREMFPSIQAKIWGSIGKVSDLIDTILEIFLERSLEPQTGFPVVEILADTAVALASANVTSVSSKIITLLCSVFENTCCSPTTNLEQHANWQTIMILSRYLLTLSFNNCLDVVEHLPYLFHAITMLAHTGPLNIRASIHGLAINIIHSLCTCSKPTFTAETQRILQMSLDEFSLRKYYSLFGISNVKSASITAFRYTTPQATMNTDLGYSDPKFQSSTTSTNACANLKPILKSSSSDHFEKSSIPLSSLEVITDALFEIMETCVKDIPDCEWLTTWTKLAKHFAFRYNTALQPRALIVYGCISKSTNDHDIRELLRLLVKALDKSSDLALIESPIICLTRLQPLLRPESKIHGFIFWIGISVLQLENEDLFEAGLSLIEQNLNILDSQGVFDEKPIDAFMMAAREPIEEWYFRTLDGDVGLSFKENFHFALVGHLIKGFRHSSSATVSRTTRILSFLLGIVAKPHKRDKFEVTNESIAYLAALVAVSEEVRNRCRLQFSGNVRSNNVAATPQNLLYNLDENELASNDKVWKSFDLDLPYPPPVPPKRSASLCGHSSPLAPASSMKRVERASVSEGNILLDPEVITDPTIQVLTLTVLSTLVKYSNDETEMKIIYSYLAEGSIVFSKVFRVIYTLIDARLTSILQSGSDDALLESIQSIIHNMIACDDSSQDHLYYVHTCGFGGLWRFAGPFTKPSPLVYGKEVFANYLEAIVETILPSEETSDGSSSGGGSMIISASPMEKNAEYNIVCG